MSTTKKEKPAEKASAFGVSMAMQNAFIFFIALTAGGCIPFTYYGYVYMQEMKKNAPKDHDFPQFSDFSLTAIWSVFFAIAEMTIHKLLIPLFEPICKTQEKGKEKEKARRV